MDLECSKFPPFSRSMLQITVKLFKNEKSKKFSEFPKKGWGLPHKKFPFQNPHRKFHIKTEKQTNGMRDEISWLKKYWKENIWEIRNANKIFFLKIIKLTNLGGKLNEILNKLTKGIFYTRLSWLNFISFFFFEGLFRFVQVFVSALKNQKFGKFKILETIKSPYQTHPQTHANPKSPHKRVFYSLFSLFAQKIISFT